MYDNEMAVPRSSISCNIQCKKAFKKNETFITLIPQAAISLEQKPFANQLIRYFDNLQRVHDKVKVSESEYGIKGLLIYV